MGVSGVGKSTVGRLLATDLGWTMAEGDDFHTAAAVEKMRSGAGLTDADRGPWLARLNAWIVEREASGRSAVLTCSALRRSYRDQLTLATGHVIFCHLVAGAPLLRARLLARADHFMPVDLLDSQLELLEPLEPAETGFEVATAADPATTARVCAHWLRDLRATGDDVRTT